MIYGIHRDPWRPCVGRDSTGDVGIMDVNYLQDGRIGRRRQVNLCDAYFGGFYLLKFIDFTQKCGPNYFIINYNESPLMIMNSLKKGSLWSGTGFHIFLLDDDGRNIMFV